MCVRPLVSCGRTANVVALLVIAGLLGTDSGPLGVNAAVLPGYEPATPSVVVPTSPTTFVGHILTLSLHGASQVQNPVPELKTCLVRRPNEEDYLQLQPGKATDSLTFFGEFQAGRCGVRIQPVSHKDNGVWTLSARYGDDSFISGQTTVQVNEYSASVIPENISTDEGNGLLLSLKTLSAVSAFTTCVAVLPSGDRIPLGQAAVHGLVLHPRGALEKGECGANITSVQTNHKGTWVLEATDKESGVIYRGRAQVHVYAKQMQVLPLQVEAEEGDTAVFKLEFSNERGPSPTWTGCRAVRPDGKSVQLLGQDPATDVVLDNTVRLNSERGGCAMTVGPLNQNHSGIWRMVATADDITTRQARTRIFVKAPYTSGTRPAVTAVVGSRGQLVNCGPGEAVSCTLKDPAGQTAAILQGPCVYTLDRVRPTHNGTWTCSALVKGYSAPVDDVFTLELASPIHTLTGVGRSGGGAVLHCRLVGMEACSSSVDYCRMDAPDGRSLLVKEGVEGGRYSYAGQGLSACDCSMAIADPQAGDFGVWRCVMGFGRARPRGGLIALHRGGAGRQARVTDATDAVSVTPIRTPTSGIAPSGSTITVGCRANRPLSYCWLRTPRGEHIALDETAVSLDKPRYGGMGLELGECAVTLDAASETNHTGTWRCGVGVIDVEGGSESPRSIEVPVDMVLSDSLVVAVQTDVTVSSTRATLGCRSFMGEALHYCRFQKPDGSSLVLGSAARGPHEEHHDASSNTFGRYSYDSEGGRLEGGYCGVLIFPVTEEDLGEWTCIVGLAGDVAGQEQAASVRLADLGGAAEATLTGLSIGIVALVMLAAVVFIYRRFRSTPGRYRNPAGRRSPFTDDDEDVSPAATSSMGMTTRSRVRPSGSTSEAAASPARMQTTRLPAQPAQHAKHAKHATRSRGGLRTAEEYAAEDAGGTSSGDSQRPRDVWKTS